MRTLAVLTTTLTLLVGASAVRADDPATMVLVIGAPGAPAFESRFKEWTAAWRKAAQRAGARLVTVGGAESASPPDRERLRAALAAEARGAGELWLVLLGHGTFDGRSAKLNLRGPDVSAEELAAWLAPVNRPTVVLHTTSASAPFLKPLARKDRIVVTATRSGHEQNATRLGGFLADAIADPAADLDRDGQTSVLEAFLVAAKRVDAAFTEAGLLATEHALLDDDGDGVGTPAAFYSGVRAAKKAASGGVPDGRRARQLALVRSEPERSLSEAKRRRRDTLELQLMSLRDGRDTLPEAEYYRRLEPIALELARLYAGAAR